jgi:Fe-S oxidoreductase
MHRANPSCSSCHSFIDPIGLALDNFDVTGRWRIREDGAQLDTRGTYYDGTDIETPGDLARVLLKRPVPIVRQFTEGLMAYGLGRALDYRDQPAVRAIAAAAEKNDYRIHSFILGVAGSIAFRMKQAPADGDGGNADS